MFVSSIAFYALFVALNGFGRSSSHQSLAALILRQGVDVYEGGGAKKLGAYIEGTNGLVDGDLHIVDSQGRDLVTDRDDSDLLRNSNDILGRPKVANGRVGISAVSADKRFQLAGVLYTQRSNPWLFVVPYFLIIAAATALVCWLLAVGIVVSP